MCQGNPEASDPQGQLSEALKPKPSDAQTSPIPDLRTRAGPKPSCRKARDFLRELGAATPVPKGNTQSLAEGFWELGRPASGPIRALGIRATVAG